MKFFWILLLISLPLQAVATEAQSAGKSFPLRKKPAAEGSVYASKERVYFPLSKARVNRVRPASAVKLKAVVPAPKALKPETKVEPAVQPPVKPIYLDALQARAIHDIFGQ
jgi:hypothetical protein